MNKLQSYDDRKIYLKLTKLSDIELLAYAINSNIVILERMKKMEGGKK